MIGSHPCALRCISAPLQPSLHSAKQDCEEVNRQNCSTAEPAVVANASCQYLVGLKKDLRFQVILGYKSMSCFKTTNKQKSTELKTLLLKDGGLWEDIMSNYFHLLNKIYIQVWKYGKL